MKTVKFIILRAGRVSAILSLLVLLGCGDSPAKPESSHTAAQAQSKDTRWRIHDGQ